MIKRLNSYLILMAWATIVGAVCSADDDKVTLQSLSNNAGDGYFRPYHNGEAVLLPGDPGTWDGGAIGTSTVVKVGNTYHMYYEAWKRLDEHHNDSDYATLQIGHATSTDGIHWTKDPANPVLPRGKDGEWDAGGTWDPCVLYENGKFKLWHGGGGGGVGPCDWGYAESTDGTHFIKKGRISHLGQEEDDRVVHDTEHGKYYMYYWDRAHLKAGHGLWCAIGTTETNLDFDHATNIRIDGVKYPDETTVDPGVYKFSQVFRDHDKWVMIFDRSMGMAKEGDLVLYAESDDLIHWRVLNQCLLNVHDTAVLKAADDLWLMYYGSDGQYDTVGGTVSLAIMKGRLENLNLTKPPVNEQAAPSSATHF